MLSRKFATLSLHLRERSATTAGWIAGSLSDFPDELEPEQRIEAAPAGRNRTYQSARLPGKIGAGADAIEVLDDRHVVVSNVVLLGGSKRAWVVRDPDGNWRYASLASSFANGVRRLGDGLVLADYRARLLYPARVLAGDIVPGEPLLLDAHPDNLAADYAGGLTVAAQRSLVSATLHVAFSARIPASSKIFRVRKHASGLTIEPTEIQPPSGAAAVSTAIETENWWYFSQIRRPGIYACRKSV